MVHLQEESVLHRHNQTSFLINLRASSYVNKGLLVHKLDTFSSCPNMPVAAPGLP